MPRQHWNEAISWATTDSAAVANTVTRTVLFPDVPIPAHYLQDGRVLHIKAFGKISTTGTPTFIWDIRLGGVNGTLLATTDAITMGSAVANVNWELEAYLQTRVNGSSGSVLVMGTLRVHTGSGTTVVQQVFGVSGHDAPAAVTVDLTQDQNLSVTGTWSAASASNTATGLLELVEVPN